MSTRTTYAVAVRFEAMLSRIQPLPSADADARARAARVRGALARQGYDVSRSVIVGSLNRGTAIRDYSDVDFFVVLSRESVRWGGSYVASGTILNNVRAAVRATYPTTDVGRDGAAVRVQFTRGDMILDVVPAIYEGPSATGHPVYSIPDGQTGWLRTSPDIQQRYVTAAHVASGHRLCRVAQAVKWWARAGETSVPLSSIFVELLLAQAGMAVAQRYSTLLRDAFVLLHDRVLRPLSDPTGIGAPIDAAPTAHLKDQVRGSLARAAQHAAHAHEAEQRGDSSEAIRRWRLLFGSTFPG
jgi:hypothetical protein